jgi:hypothetical protein
MTAIESAPSFALRRSKVPVTLWIGLAIILICEAMLFTDVYLSKRGALQTHAEIQSLRIDNPPTTSLGKSARWFAVNMTASAGGRITFFCWPSPPS